MQGMVLGNEFGAQKKADPRQILSESYVQYKPLSYRALMI